MRRAGATMIRTRTTAHELITAMDNQLRLHVANRIHLGLMRELGQGIDVKQMLGSALYARDVLLVCQACQDSELRRLGEQFRQASTEPNAGRAAQRAGHRRDSRGFGASRPSPPHSAFDEVVDSLTDTRQPSRRWLTPSTWFAR
jgi:hypothetical protein